MPKAIEIFRTGRHQSMGGDTLTFGEADLAAAAAAYDPKLHEAPLVVGHPEHNAPAYGWVKALAFADGSLNAEPDQVDAAFAEMVQKGRFKKVSASFYTPDSPNNPKPGVYYLRHVGFLGAQPPAVKGLRPAEFADDSKGVVTFGDFDDRMIIRLFRGLRDLLISKFGQDDADKALPPDTLNYLADDAAQPEPNEPMNTIAYAERKAEIDRRVQELADREADIAARETALNTRTQEFAERDRTAHRAEFESFVDGLVNEGKVIPATKDQLVAFMERLQGADAIEFGEGDKKTTKAAVDSFKEFLTGLPKVVTFGETAKHEGTPTARGIDLAPDAVVDPARLELHNKAVAFMEKNKGVDYVTAVKTVEQL